MNTVVFCDNGTPRRVTQVWQLCDETRAPTASPTPRRRASRCSGRVRSRQLLELRQPLQRDEVVVGPRGTPIAAVDLDRAAQMHQSRLCLTLERLEAREVVEDRRLVREPLE